MIKGLLCHLRIIVFVVVYALGAYAPFDQHFADAQGVSPGSGGSPGQNVCPQCPASGTGDASCCCCLEQHIRNYDGGNVPNWFLDADPLDGAREPRDYEIKELTGSDLENAEIDPNESELTGVVDAWDMTPQEIFEAEYAKLKTLGEQWLVDRIIDSNGPPAAIPKVGYGYRNNTDYPIYSDLKERGLLQYVDTDYYQFQEYGGPSIVWYGLKLRNSMCFYSCSYAYSSTEQSDGWMCQSSPRLWKCISNKWMTTLTTPSERLREARSAHGNEAIEMGVFVLDFAVGMTPFLGTADQVAQDWDKLKELDPAAVGMCLGGAAGDVVIVGKLSQLIKGANAASKFGKAVTVTSYAAGAGSVAAGATSLYLQNRGDWKEGSTWGRAAFFGIQAIGLITDRDAHRIIAPHIKRIALKAKMPQALAACKSGCGWLKDKVKLFVRDESGTLYVPNLLPRLLKAKWTPVTDGIPDSIQHKVFTVEDFEYVPYDGVNQAFVVDAITGDFDKVVDDYLDFLKQTPPPSGTQAKNWQLIDTRNPDRGWSVMFWGDATTWDRLGFPVPQSTKKKGPIRDIDLFTASSCSQNGLPKTSPDDWILVSYYDTTTKLDYHFAYNLKEKFRVLHYLKKNNEVVR